jgi:hypothetical protein
VGGTHYRTLVHQDVCYQTFGPNLLVLPKGEAVPIRKVPLGPEGETGPAVDMTIIGERMFLVLQGDALLELSLADPNLPKVEKTIDAARLGIRPRTLSVADGELFVSGGGGVVRVRDLDGCSRPTRSPAASPRAIMDSWCALRGKFVGWRTGDSLAPRATFKSFHPASQACPRAHSSSSDRPTLRRPWD